MSLGCEEMVFRYSMVERYRQSMLAMKQRYQQLMCTCCTAAVTQSAPMTVAVAISCCASVITTAETTPYVDVSCSKQRLSSGRLGRGFSFTYFDATFCHQPPMFCSCSWSSSSCERSTNSSSQSSAPPGSGPAGGQCAAQSAGLAGASWATELAAVDGGWLGECRLDAVDSVSEPPCRSGPWACASASSHHRSARQGSGGPKGSAQKPGGLPGGCRGAALLAQSMA
mmetsp:Transcript_21040/g.66478  ORF Transcript_21040/g.66478 Transcript_21040/m.66478 type:complete len:226 (-) Transcript_21040:144-821(-)